LVTNIENLVVEKPTSKSINNSLKLPNTLINDVVYQKKDLSDTGIYYKSTEMTKGNLEITNTEDAVIYS